MERILAMLMLLIMLISIPACAYEDDKPDDGSPYISEYSSCWPGSARGEYTVSAEDYGVLTSGRAYASREKAVGNPLEIQSQGYEITITLADSDAVTYTFNAGDEEIISCKSGSFNGYLYVIVT